MFLLIKLVDAAATPEGSGPSFGPKNHSNISDELEGMLSGRGSGVIVAEHTRVEFPPAMLEPEGEIVTLVSTA